MNLSVLQREFLEATIALVGIQREMLVRIHQFLGVSAYDFWIRRVKPDRAQDDLGDDEWKYNFHGLELDIQNRRDGRFARLEFGPRGMDNVFSVSSIGIFAVSTRLPWPIFPRLKRYLLEDGKYPHAQRTGDLFQALLDAGFIQPSDANLLSIRNKCTRLNELGQNVIDLPDELAPSEMLDAFLCDNFVLSTLASQASEGNKGLQTKPSINCLDSRRVNCSGSLNLAVRGFTESVIECLLRSGKSNNYQRTNVIL